MKKLSLLITCWSISLSVCATNIANNPLNPQNIAKPNLIIALDDSGSMDFEVLLQANDGALWWDDAVKSFTDNQGLPLFNLNGNVGADGSHFWYKYVYLFPNGVNSDTRRYSDASDNHFAIPPIPAYAFMRSADYNPLYYNPQINYSFWTPAYYNGSTTAFSNASLTAARSHPIYPLSGTATTINLTLDLFSTADDWTFRMLPGMVIPGATMSGTRGRKVGYSNWTNINTNYTIPNNEAWDVAFNYYPATYYVKDATCTSGTQCFSAPDGSKLRQYQIKSGNTFPSGRSYSAEMQNFANWFTYYRKRKLMLTAAAGSVFPQINGLRGGITTLNNLSPVTMYDFDDSADSRNWKALLGVIGLNTSNSGTPTRDALNYIGNQYRTNKNIIQYPCQYNAAMVLTDGFAYASGPSTPSYTSATWGNKPPFTPIYANSLADLALAYYTLNLRPDLTSGLIGIDSTNTAANADLNPNLHMNTYALGIGTKGTIYGTGTAQALNPYQNFPAWPNPNTDRSPTAVDDLWHATINGRGSMVNASDPQTAVSELATLLGESIIKTGAGSAITVSNVNLQSNNNIAYVSSYNNGYGDLQTYPINLDSGVVNTSSIGWSAQQQLDKMAISDRRLATYNGSSGIPLQWANLSTTMRTQLNSTQTPPGPSDGASVLAWLRGDPSLEATNYRQRIHLLGDIVDAEPVIVSGAIANYSDTGYSSFISAQANRTPIVYQGANDGYLHAFSATTGNELWGYMPRLLFGSVNQLASKLYSHRFYVDGTPFIADVFWNSAWHTILIGGLHAGGNGYYALDITNPAAANEASVASKVLWEFPNLSTSSTIANNVGLSFGKPVVAKTTAVGWVVLVTSGYNNTSGDGKGHLFILDPQNGQLIKELVTTSGTSAAPSGLGQISAYAKNAKIDATIDFVYGGDLNGNLWRFDLTGSNISNWNVKLLATLVDKAGNPQPITTAPELNSLNNQRMIYLGTGQLLAVTDIANTQSQTMYGLVDNMSNSPTISPLRTNLVQQIVTGTTITANSVDYSQKRGWYFDLPEAGERVTSDPILAFGSVIFNTNQPSASACTSSSYEYIVNQFNGGQLANSQFNNQTPFARVAISTAFATRPVIVVLPDGTVKSITHNTDNTLSTINLPLAITTQIRKVAWKEILR